MWLLVSYCILHILSVHLLQVTAIEGEFSETMVLDQPIPAQMDAQTWLKVLEKSMKTTITKNFAKCLIETWSRNEDETAVSDFVEKGNKVINFLMNDFKV